MSWFENEGKHPSHTVLTQTRYIRNIHGIPFWDKCDPKTRESIFSKADSILTQNGFRKEPADAIDPIYLGALAEKGFIDNDFLDSPNPRALYFNEPCSLAVSLGGKEHVTIRSLISGKASADSRNIASGAEELLDGNFEFAYSENLGYLASRPSACGSGAEFSAILYLPSLRLDGTVELWRKECRLSGAELSPMTASHENPGDLYVLSYSPSHRSDEGEAVMRFDALQDKLIKEERTSEGIIFAKRSKLIIDAAWRAFGILLYAKKLSFGESLALSSDMRLALAVAKDQADLPPVGIVQLNTILGEGADCSVIASSGGQCASLEECEELRAGFVSKLFS